MGVKIVSAADTAEQCSEADYLRVRTFAAPDDDTVTLATIERFIEKTHRQKITDPAWKVRTLVLEKPMSSAEAMGFARCYAERKHIPLVVTDTE